MSKFSVGDTVVYSCEGFAYLLEIKGPAFCDDFFRCKFIRNLNNKSCYYDRRKGTLSYAKEYMRHITKLEQVLK